MWGSHNTHCGALSLCIPLPPPSSCPWLQEARHRLGMKGARRQDGGQIHTGCESLCAATSHSHCDSSARSSARLTVLAGRRRERCRGICSSSSPVLQGRACAQPGTLPSVYGRSSGAGTGEGEKRGGMEYIHLQIGCRAAFPFSGYTKGLARRITHRLHSRGGEQPQTRTFGSKIQSDLDREGTANNPRVSLQSVRAVSESCARTPQRHSWRAALRGWG